MSDIPFIADLGDVLDGAIHERERTRSRPATRGAQRPRRRALAPAALAATLLAAGGATSVSLLTAAPTMAAETVNCHFPGHPTQLTRRQPTTPGAALSIDTCRQWYRLHVAGAGGAVTIALIACRKDASTVDVYVATAPGETCAQFDESAIAPQRALPS